MFLKLNRKRNITFIFFFIIINFLSLISLGYADVVADNPNDINDHGISPSITILPSGAIIEVHQSEYNSSLWSSVGTVGADNKIIFGADDNYDNSNEYGLPAVAAVPDNSNRIVAIHDSIYGYDPVSRQRWYNVGIVDVGNKKINWKAYDNKKMGDGERSAIVIVKDPKNSNFIKIVEIHESDHHNTLWYTVGTFEQNSNKINWYTFDNVHFDNGACPSVTAVFDKENNLYIVEAHISAEFPYSTEFFYNIGKFNIDTSRIDWQAPASMKDSGIGIKITATPDGKILAVHNSQNRHDLYYSIGTFAEDHKSINWSDAHLYNDGGEGITITSLIYDAFGVPLILRPIKYPYYLLAMYESSNSNEFYTQLLWSLSEK